MINLLLPIAGNAKRFINEGYRLPKPLISVGDKTMIELAVSSVIPSPKYDLYKLIFVVLESHCVEFQLDEKLREIFSGYQVEIVVTKNVTKGTLCSCLLASQFIDNDDPLIIYTPDVYFESDVSILRTFHNTCDALLLTFKANSPDHSYVLSDCDGLAISVAEKVVISNNALVGVYCFARGSVFVKYGKMAIDNGEMVNGEFYVAPIFNHLIIDKFQVYANPVSSMHVLGTPADLDFYCSYVHRYIGVARFAICSDHSGYDLKRRLVLLLAERDIEYKDFGCFDDSDSDHYDYLKPCLDFIGTTSEPWFGIASCSTGQGFNIAANKYSGVRSAIVYDRKSAKLAREHNAASFFCIPSDVSDNQLYDIVAEIIGSAFTGGRHSTRIRKFNNDSKFIK